MELWAYYFVISRKRKVSTGDREGVRIILYYNYTKYLRLLLKKLLVIANMRHTNTIHVFPKDYHIGKQEDKEELSLLDQYGVFWIKIG